MKTPRSEIATQEPKPERTGPSARARLPQVQQVLPAGPAVSSSRSFGAKTLRYAQGKLGPRLAVYIHKQRYIMPLEVVHRATFKRCYSDDSGGLVQPARWSGV